MKEPLVEAIGVRKYFKTPRGMLHAVEDVNFKIYEGKTLGVVGESGCGKSTLGRTVLRLHQATAGEVLFRGENILAYKRREMHKVQRNMQMIFQDPYSSLDPRLSVRSLIMEPIEVVGTGEKLSKSEKRDKACTVGGRRYEAASGNGTPGALRTRLSAWWRNLPLMRSFACYTAICLVLSGVISVALMVACREGYHYLDRVENEGRTEVDGGPYIYDAASAELVPAVSIDLGCGTGNCMLYVGMRRGTGRASVETDKGSPQVINASTERPVVYATLERIASDDGLNLYDWGGNYTEADYIEAGGNPYDPEPIAADELARYDERERRERLSAAGELGGAIEQLGAANDEILTSNIGYYVSQAQTSTETTLIFALRIAAGIAPFAVLSLP